MGKVPRYPHGTFCWVDLGTADVAGATEFYGGLLGWSFQAIPDAGYTLCRVDGLDVAGIHSHPEEEAAAPHWDSYVNVDDVDRTLRRVRELGGEVIFEAFEIPGTARIGVIRDPSGAQLGLWQTLGFVGASLVNQTGTWTWNDLLARDTDAASTFFEGLFGWRTERAVEIYATFTMAELLVGGMRTIHPDERTPPSWMPYFVVADAEIAANRAVVLGGRVLVPPTAVPAGRFLVVNDPQGAVSALFEMGPDGPVRGVDS